jgi:hypothetical protein
VSRQVWIRLVVEARAVAGQDAVAQAATAIVAIRDL